MNISDTDKDKQSDGQMVFSDYDNDSFFKDGAGNDLLSNMNEK